MSDEKYSQGFASGVSGSYESPRVSRVILDESGNYVSSATAKDGSGTLGNSIVE